MFIHVLIYSLLYRWFTRKGSRSSQKSRKFSNWHGPNATWNLWSVLARRRSIPTKRSSFGHGQIWFITLVTQSPHAEKVPTMYWKSSLQVAWKICLGAANKLFSQSKAFRQNLTHNWRSKKYKSCHTRRRPRVVTSCQNINRKVFYYTLRKVFGQVRIYYSLLLLFLVNH